MDKPIIKIHNVETGEEIEREMNAEELAQWKAFQNEVNLEAQAKAEAAEAKATIFNRLGITEAEAKLLLS